MGLFSFLFGGKKNKAKASDAAPASKPSAAKPAAQVAKVIDTAAPPVAVSPGALQAKLRLKLAASLRTGEQAAAYEAAKALADIQSRAGRKTVARVWQQQADRIKAGLSAQL
jgi:zona occludens toxin (predicted ATPase)